MAPLPLSLIITFWLVGATWVVALMAYFFDAPGEIVWLVLFLGTATGLMEWSDRRRSK